MDPTGHGWVAPESAFEEARVEGFGVDGILHSTFRCGSCDCISLGIAGMTEFGRTVTERSELISFWRTNDVEEWEPRWVESPDYEDVPTHISAAAREAHETHSRGYYRASTILARAVIEATAKDKGADGKNLETRIDKLADLGVIMPITRNAAHVVRGSGNDMAHGDFTEEADQELAGATLEFMDLVLQDAYITPAKVAAMEAKREQSKSDRR